MIGIVRASRAKTAPAAIAVHSWVAPPQQVRKTEITVIVFHAVVCRTLDPLRPAAYAGGVKPPKLSGLLAFFDCRQLEPLSVSRSLGFAVDAATGQQVHAGYAPYVSITVLLNRPYSFVPVEGDLRREFEEYGDRLRDAKFLWLHQALELTPGVDGDGPGAQVQGDLIRRDAPGTGDVYEVTRTVPEHGKVGGLRGYLLLRAQT